MTIYARAPVAELAQILRECLPAGAQPGADLGMADSPAITPPRGISGRLRDEAEETLAAVGELGHCVGLHCDLLELCPGFPIDRCTQKHRGVSS